MSLLKPINQNRNLPTQDYHFNICYFLLLECYYSDCEIFENLNIHNISYFFTFLHHFKTIPFQSLKDQHKSIRIIQTDLTKLLNYVKESLITSVSDTAINTGLEIIENVNQIISELNLYLEEQQSVIE